MDVVDPSRIQHIVLLIDLHPFLDLKNTDPYFSSVLAAAWRILSFLAISSSLASFRFFFSPLSPIFSTYMLRDLLGKSLILTPFDRPVQTLESLECTLSSLSSKKKFPHISSISLFPGVCCRRSSAPAPTLLPLGSSESPLSKYATCTNVSFQFGGSGFSDSPNSKVLV